MPVLSETKLCCFGTGVHRAVDGGGFFWEPCQSGCPLIENAEVEYRNRQREWLDAREKSLKEARALDRQMHRLQEIRTSHSPLLGTTSAHQKDLYELTCESRAGFRLIRGFSLLKRGD